MTQPSPILSTVFADGELTNEVKWYNRIFSPINTLMAFVAGLPQGFIGESVATPGTVMSASATFYPAAPLTFTITQQRRIRVVAGVELLAGTTTGHYNLRIGYQSGASIVTGSLTAASMITATNNAVASGTTWWFEQTILLAAGQWTVAGLINRVSAGSTSDSISLSYCAAYDEGAD